MIILPVSQPNEDDCVNQHQPGEHKELRGLLIEQFRLRDADDDDVAEGNGEKPGGLNDGLHGGGSLAVGELQAGDGEHHLAGRDDEVLRELPEDVDGVRSGEGVEHSSLLAHCQGVDSALLHLSPAQLNVIDVDPAIINISN